MEREKDMRRWIAALLCLGLLWAPAGAVAGAPSDWAKAEVEKAVQAGLVPQLTGDPAYQDALTREQFAQLVVQTVEVVLDKELAAAPAGTFTDCNTPAVLKANKAGIIGGIGGGKFAPAQTTNREQIATMMARAIDYLEEDSDLSLAPKAGSLEGFTDAAQVSGWAAESMGRLTANGLMKGSGSALAPQDPCTVEQGILLLTRIYSLSTETATEPETPPVPADVPGYKDYPMVPDFGAMVNYTEEPMEGYIPRAEYENHFYEYVLPATETFVPVGEYLKEYITVLDAHGYVPLFFYDSLLSYYFYNPDYPNLVLGYEAIDPDTLWIEMITPSAPVAPVSYYPEFSGDVPDLGIATGFEMVLRRTNQDESIVEYCYKLPDMAPPDVVLTWCIQLFQADYQFVNIYETSLGYMPCWAKDGGSLYVLTYLESDYFIVRMES